jgi:hypothetical protein
LGLASGKRTVPDSETVADWDSRKDFHEVFMMLDPVAGVVLGEIPILASATGVSRAIARTLSAEFLLKPADGYGRVECKRPWRVLCGEPRVRGYHRRTPALGNPLEYPSKCIDNRTDSTDVG